MCTVGKLLNYVLPYRAIYWLFSFIVLPRRNHRMSRWIFRRQSLRLTPGEYLKWVELYKPFFSGSSNNTWSAKWTSGDWSSWGRRTTFFLALLRNSPRAQKNMRLAVIENCGHVCSIEAPDLFNDLVLKFLSGQEVPLRVKANPVPSSWADLKALQG